MRIGVIEIMETGHITFAETLCRIFCCDPGNHVYLFTIEKHAGNLGFLCNIYPNLDIVVKDAGREMKDFLNETGEYNLDRIYLVTLTKYFKTVSSWQLKTRLFLTIHNIDEWFGITFFESLKRFFYSVTGTSSMRLWIYFFKVSFIFPPLKRDILKKVICSEGSLVVLSNSLQKSLNALKTDIPSEVIPFSVFEPSLVKNRSLSGQKVRICVPGILSQYRRNYLGLLDIVETRLDKLKDLFVLDLLGGVRTENQFDNPALILNRVNVLRTKGFSIIVRNVQFIPPGEYDTELAKADIILGNMNIALTRYSSYGKTKETGIPFAMIRAALPGIMPDVYPVPEELSSGTLVYHDFRELGEMLTKVISDRSLIDDLKKKALENSKKYSPESIYKSLTGQSQF